MMRLFEPLVFGAVALLVHVAIWEIPDGTPEGAGSQGDDLVSLAAADGDMQQMVAQWDQSPEVGEVQQIDQVLPPEDQPDLPTPEIDAPIDTSAPDLDTPDQPDLDPTRAQIAAPSVAAPAMPQISAPQVVAAVALPINRPSTPLATPQPPAAALPKVDTRPVLPAEVITREDTTLAESLRPKVPSKPRPKRITPPKPKKQAKAPPKKTAKAQKRNSTKTSKGGGSSARRAKGTGNKGTAGRNGASDTPSLSKGKKASLVKIWGSKIRRTLVRRRLTGAGRGSVLVEMQIARTGKLISVRVVRSSGNARLDRAALSMVRRVGRFPAAPKALRLGQYPFRIKVEGE